jgi:rhodanese-related sulfurtransferase
MPRSRQSSKAAQRRKAVQPNLVWLWVTLGIVAVAVVAFFLFQPAASATPEISVAQVYQKYPQGAFFLDVRTQAEWDKGHLTNSTLIPLDQLPNRLSEVPKDQDVVVLCRSGVRAKQGASILRNAGYTRAVSMTGGLLAWKAAGYPFEGNGP